MNKYNISRKRKGAMISIIIPCYNEQEALPIFYSEITRVLDEMHEKYELLFINDGSKDNTLDILKNDVRNVSIHLMLLLNPSK